MGVYLCVQRLPDHEDHPEWDFGKYVGDREFMDMMLSALPCVVQKEGENPWVEDIRFNYRPADPDAWRQAIAVGDWGGVGNKDRLFELVDILESQPEYWVYCSV